MSGISAPESPAANAQNHKSTLALVQQAPRQALTPAQAPAQRLLLVDLMQDTPSSPHEKQQLGLSAHEEARALVRLIQCPICSKPFNIPVTLPCGRSLCRSCLPDSHERARITWPDLPDRRRAISCPFVACGDDHTVADCCVDVVLYKIMDSVAEALAVQDSVLDVSNKQDSTTDLLSKSIGRDPVNVESQSRLLDLYNLAVAGQLSYEDDDDFSLSTVDSEDRMDVDEAVLTILINVCNKELDCQVCYNLMLDPVTTPCGHTLCRNCLVRSLDHSRYCPICRRVLLLPPSLQSHPSNKALGKLLNGLCPELVAARKEAVKSEELLNGFDIPLFVVTLGFPGCPTFLRIFEPRYRLMLRRVLEGNRTFGMVMHNASRIVQEGLGRSQFMQYGTLLRIENAQIMPDGTSIVETRGISRFKVLSSGTLDGYAIGRVERVEDIPLAEEEAIEARELALPPAELNDIDGQLSHMSTQQLLSIGLGFVQRMQSRSEPWLHEGILSAYGGPPDDAALFPYWFASILPTDDMAKYHLLQATSVRQRLKVTAKWVKVMENQRWYRSNACTVL